MNIVLWVLAILLAVAFVAAGGTKLVKSKEALLATPNMGWAADFSASQIKAIGAAEVLGGLGLVLPALTGIATVLTPVAALCLALLMAGAVVVHVRRHEPPAAAAVLGVLALVLAVLRFGPFPF